MAHGTTGAVRIAPSRVLLALMALGGGRAQAQPRHPVRVAVGLFTGLRAEQARTLVFNALAEHGGDLELVSRSDTDASVDRLGIRAGADDAAAQLGRDLRLDDAVVGTFERRGARYRLQLRVVRGRDGQGAGTASWEVERETELNTLRGEIWDQIRGYLRADTGNARGVRQAPGDPQGGSPTSTEADPPRTDAPGEGMPAAAATTDVSPGTGGRTPGVGWLVLSLGGGVSGRSWRLPILGEPTARGYDNNGYGELQGALGLYYPFAHQRMGIGVAARIALPLGLSSQGRMPDLRVVPLATSALEFTVGPSLVVRPVSGGSFGVGVGLVLHSFDINTAPLAPEQRLANTGYLGLRVAGEGVLPVWATPRWEVGVLFGGELRWVGVGADMRTAFGAYPNTTLGYGASFGLAARLDGATPGLGLRVWAEFLRYRTGFTGTAMVGTASDSVDDYTRIVLAVTYAFGGGGGGGGGEPAEGTVGRAGDPFIRSR